MAQFEFTRREALRHVDQVLQLISDYRGDSSQGSDWLDQELLRMQTSDESVDYASLLGSTIAALLEVSTHLLEGWATAAQRDPEDIVAIFRRFVERELDRPDS